MTMYPDVYVDQFGNSLSGPTHSGEGFVNPDEASEQAAARDSLKIAGGPDSGWYKMSGGDKGQYGTQAAAKAVWQDTLVKYGGVQNTDGTWDMSRVAANAETQRASLNLPFFGATDVTGTGYFSPVYDPEKPLQDRSLHPNGRETDYTWGDWIEMNAQNLPNMEYLYDPSGRERGSATVKDLLDSWQQAAKDATPQDIFYSRARWEDIIAKTKVDEQAALDVKTKIQTHGLDADTFAFMIQAGLDDDDIKAIFPEFNDDSKTDLAKEAFLKNPLVREQAQAEWHEIANKKTIQEMNEDDLLIYQAAFGVSWRSGDREKPLSPTSWLYKQISPRADQLAELNYKVYMGDIASDGTVFLRVDRTIDTPKFSYLDGTWRVNPMLDTWQKLGGGDQQDIENSLISTGLYPQILENGFLFGDKYFRTDEQLKAMGWQNIEEIRQAATDAKKIGINGYSELDYMNAHPTLFQPQDYIDLGLTRAKVTNGIINDNTPVDIGELDRLRKEPDKVISEWKGTPVETIDNLAKRLPGVSGETLQRIHDAELANDPYWNGFTLTTKGQKDIGAAIGALLGGSEKTNFEIEQKILQGEGQKAGDWRATFDKIGSTIIDNIQQAMGDAFMAIPVAVFWNQWEPDSSPEFKAELDKVMNNWDNLRTSSEGPKALVDLYHMAQTEYSEHIPVLQQGIVALGMQVLAVAIDAKFTASMKARISSKTISGQIDNALSAKAEFESTRGLVNQLESKGVLTAQEIIDTAPLQARLQAAEGAYSTAKASLQSWKPSEAFKTATRMFNEAVKAATSEADVIAALNTYDAAKLMDIGVRDIRAALGGGTGKIARLAPTGDEAQNLLTPDNLRRFGKNFSKTPVGRFLIQIANPSGTVTDKVREGAFVYGFQKAKGQVHGFNETAHITSQERMLTAKLSGENAGIATNVKYTGNKGWGTHVLDVLKDPMHYEFTEGPYKGQPVANHPQMKAIIKLLEGERLDMLKEAGFDLKLLNLEKEGMHYFPQAVAKEYFDKLSAGKLTEKDFIKARSYESATEGRTNGIKYESDYYKVLQKIIVDSYQLVAKQNYLNYVSKLDMPITELRQRQGLVKDYLEVQKSIYKNVTANNAMSILYDIKVYNRPLFNQIMGGKSTPIQLKNLAQRQLDLAQFAYDETMKQGIKSVRGTEGLTFNQSEIDQITKVLKTQDKSNFLKATQNVNDAARFLMTGFDVGAPLIHGLPVLYNNPKAWATGVGNMFKAMFTPEWERGYAAANQDIIRQMVTEGNISFDSGQFMERGFLSKVPVTKPFERGFGGFLDTAKVELWKGLYRPGMTAIEKMQLGNYIEKLTGTMGKAQLGMTQELAATQEGFTGWFAHNQAALENLSLFASRYYRSQIGLGLDIFRGGLRGSAALKAMTAYNAGMLMTYYFLAEVTKPLTGYGARLNPDEEGFMQFHLPNTNIWIGPGGFQRSFDSAILKMLIDAGQGKWDKVGGHVVNWVRGHSSIPVGIAWDTITGKNYIGNSVVDAGLWGWLADEGRRVMPLSIQGAMELPNPVSLESLTAFITASLGLNSTPANKFPYMEKANNIAIQQTGHDINWLMNNGQMKQAYDILNIPAIRSMQAGAEGQRIAKGPGWSEYEHDYFQYAPQRDNLRNQQINSIAKTAHDLQAGIIDLSTAKEQWRTADKAYSEGIDSLRNQYPHLDDSIYSPSGPLAGADPERAAYIAYKDIMNTDQRLVNSRTNEEYFKNLNTVKQEYIDKWGLEAWQHSKMLDLTGRGLDSMYIAYKLDQDYISNIKQDGQSFFDMKNRLASEGGDKNEIYRFLYEHPEVEAKLYTWGNSIGRGDPVRPQTWASYEISRNIIDSLGLNKGVPAPVDMRYRGDIEADKAQAKFLYEQLTPEDKKSNPQVQQWLNRAYDARNRIQALSFGVKGITDEKVVSTFIQDMNKNIEALVNLKTEIDGYQNKGEPYYKYLASLMGQFTKEYEDAMFYTQSNIDMEKYLQEEAP